MKTNYIKGLDGLRCFSVLLVLFDHLGLNIWLHRIFDTNIADRIYLFVSGKTGVSVFFVISGYLITHLLIEEKRLHQRIDIKKFFARRFFRLFPAFFVFMIVLLFFLLYASIQNGGESKNIIGAWCIGFIYLYNFVPYGSLRIPELGHTWSLAVEEQFYIIWAIAVRFMNEKIIIIMLIGSFFCFILLKLYYDLLPISSIYESYRLTIPGAFPIVLGCLVAVFSRSKFRKMNTTYYGFI